MKKNSRLVGSLLILRLFLGKWHLLLCEKLYIPFPAEKMSNGQNNVKEVGLVGLKKKSHGIIPFFCKRYLHYNQRPGCH